MSKQTLVLWVVNFLQRVMCRLRRCPRGELEVAILVSAGRSSKEVASDLDLSTRTVEKHRANIMEKLGVREVASLVRWVMQNGLG